MNSQKRFETLVAVVNSAELSNSEKKNLKRIAWKMVKHNETGMKWYPVSKILIWADK